MITTFSLHFLSFWHSYSKAPSFYVFCVAISAKTWHSLIQLALATISYFTLQQIL